MLVVNLSLNQTLLIFLLYKSQTKETQLILAISMWGVIFLNYLSAWSCSLFQDVSISLSPKVIVLGNFNVHRQMTWWTLLKSQKTLLKLFTFQSWSLTVFLTILFFRIYLFLLTLLLLLQWLLLSIGKFWSFCLSFHWLSFNLKCGCSFSFHSFWLFSYSLGCSLWSSKTCSTGRYLQIGCFY